QPQRSLGHSPLFQILFTLHNNYWHRIELDGLQLTEPVRNEASLKYDLELAAAEQDGGLTLNWQFNSTIFDDETIHRMADNFLTLITSVIKNSQICSGEIELVHPKEKQRLLCDWNATENKAAVEFDLIGAFEKMVSLYPNKQAAADQNTRLTYIELNSRVNKLAALLQKNGVKEGSLVAVCLPRQLDLLVSVMAILKAGAGYVPVDPTYPIDRISYMLNNSRAECVITYENLVGKLYEKKSLNTKPLIIDSISLQRDLANLSGGNPVKKRDTASAAYVIYTSGSTGLPKGVCIPYGALGNFLASISHKPGITSVDNLLAVTSISFDIAGLELYLPLVNGASLYLASAEDVLDSRALQILLESQDITFMQATPATWRLLIEDDWPGKSNLKILCGGEAWPCKLREQLISRAASVWNMYGPTETTIWSTLDEVRSDAREISIGNPIANTQVYILNKQKQLVPQGGIGELYIGGEGLAKGYYEKPELTDEKFIHCKFPMSAKIYGTGDLARWRNDGKLQYMGREDQQIKIRGFRIEIEEIEKVLLSFPGVDNAVGICKTSDTDDKTLIAYVLASHPVTTEDFEKKLLAHCAMHLPHYMVPLRCILLDKFPLTLNNKIDKKTLQARAASIIKEDTPKTPLQIQILNIWSELLAKDCSGVSMESSFFELGGHSLLVVKLINKFKQHLSIGLQIKHIFDYPSLKDMSYLIEQKLICNIVDDEISLPIQNKFDSNFYIASSAQQRMYFLQQINNETTYNIPLALEIQGDISSDRVVHIVTQIVRKYDALRTIFKQSEVSDAGVVAEVLDNPDFKIPVTHIGTTDPTWLINNNRNTSFDLSCFPLFKAHVLDVSERKVILLFNIHHIVFDGWSISLFCHDLLQYCQQHNVITELGNINPAITYQSYADWQVRRLATKSYEAKTAYWLHRLSDLAEQKKIVPDAQIVSPTSNAGEVFELPLSLEMQQNLQLLCEQHNVTLFVLVLALLNIQIWNYTEQTDIAIGTAVANRDMPEFEYVIGLLINTLVLRNTFNPILNFKNFIQQVKENFIRDIGYRDVPFEKVVDQLTFRERGVDKAIFNVMLNVQEKMVGMPRNDFSITHISQDWNTSKFDITVNLEKSSDSIYGYIEYKIDVFKRHDIENIYKDMQSLIQHLVEKTHRNLFDLPCTHHGKSQVMMEANQELEELFQF
ncbi:MAG: amino acid adenylation domain-containing protein, partial [Pseudomonadota bacterium]